MALVDKLKNIGDAIRNKNGSTGKLTLDGMVTAINDMASVTIDGVKVTKSMAFVSEYEEGGQQGNLPTAFSNGGYPIGVVYNNEIHMFTYSSSTEYHYKLNGSTWTSVSTPIQITDNARAVVFNKNIHILGGPNDTYNQYHYKWNGTSWTKASTLPFNFKEGAAVVLNNNIHILGGIGGYGSYYTYHYKWNGSSWTKASTIPYNFYRGCAVVLNNELHLLGDGFETYYKYHYKWNGKSWSSVSTLPYNFLLGSAVVLNNEILILGGNGNGKKHYKWDGSSWASVGTLPYDFVNGVALVKGEALHILASDSTSAGKNKHYIIIAGKIYRKVA